MNPFTITNHISKKEFIRFVFQRTYRKWYMVLISICSAFSLLVTLLQLANIGMGTVTNPSANLAVAAYVWIIIPFILWYRSGKQYESNKKVQQTIEYTFDDVNVAAKGNDFETKYAWENVYKIEESKQFILLFASRVMIELIRKDQLTPQQRLDILSKSIKK